jgi:hypothetical protein
MQHTSLSPDGKLVAIVGDNPEGLIVDTNSGKVSRKQRSAINFQILTSHFRKRKAHGCLFLADSS